MRRLIPPCAALVLIGLATVPSGALAQAKIITLDDEPREDRADGRYVFREVDDGLLRLDNQTGEVSHCAPSNSGWACQTVSEEQHDYEQEISRLQSEIADLRAALRERAAPPEAPLVVTPPPAPTAPLVVTPPPAASGRDGDQTAAIAPRDAVPAPTDNADTAQPSATPTPSENPQAKQETEPEDPPQTQPATVRRMTLMERAWQRLLELMVNLQRQLKRS